MFGRRGKGPWPPSPPEPSFPTYKYTIANINEVVSGGILRAGKTDYGSGTGWWLGIDPADDEAKFDIGTPTDYLRYNETEGVKIAADGSGLTNITGGNITAANLAVISAQTGALTVDNTLTMGLGGIITWMSGAATITENYMDMQLAATNRYAFRFLDGENVHGHMAGYISDNLTQVSLEAIGPAAGKYGKLAFTTSEADILEPETVDVVIRSDMGVLLSALNYYNTCIFKVDTMDAYFTNRVGIGVSPPTSRLQVTGAAGETVNLVSITGETTGDILSLSATGKPSSGAWQALSSKAYVAMQGDMTSLYGMNLNMRMQETSGYTATRAFGAFARLTLDNDFAGTMANFYGFNAEGIQDNTDSHGFTITKYYGLRVAAVTLATKVYGVASEIAAAANRWNLYCSGSADNYLNGDTGIKTSAPTAALDVNSDIVRLRTAKTPASAGAAGNAGDKCWDADYEYRCVATSTWKRQAIATW